MITDDWIIEGEVITNFYVDENKVVFVETENEYWYNFDEELGKS